MLVVLYVSPKRFDPAVAESTSICIALLFMTWNLVVEVVEYPAPQRSSPEVEEVVVVATRTPYVSRVLPLAVVDCKVSSLS